MPASLQGVNLVINRNEKIGILGRTGSGKTSLTLGLTKMIELSDGNMLIKG